jgi:hypothetical protein
MPYINVDVDLDDIYDEMSRYDKEEMAEWLIDDGILENHKNLNIRKLVRSNEESFDEEQFRNNLTKLWSNFYQLSNEDEEIIKTIANKL